MAMQYFNQIKQRRRSSQMTTHSDPVLTADDEAFLQRVTSQPEQGRSPSVEPDMSTAVSQGEDSQQPTLNENAQDIPLPASPIEKFGEELGEEERKARARAETAEILSEPAKQEPNVTSEKKKKRWSSMFWKKTGDIERNKRPTSADKSRPESSALASSATTTDNGKEAQTEEADMTDILEKLNLAADNNRVFSISDETQELLRKFKLIFKDLINGVPTAYRDLEMLLTNGNRQLQDTYTKLPSFLQKLIERLPEKWTESLAPEMLAVAGERAGRSGINLENVGKAAAAANKMGLNIPTLKDLVSKPAAIVGMLRSIMAFLRARFPAVLGMNILWSLALFILLFVLWYCHKRGREVRLENERLVTEEEINQLNQDNPEGQIRPTETLTTTAPRGASAEEVREGVKLVEEARASAADTPTPASELPTPNNENVRPPTRSKTRLSIFGRTKTEPTPSHITPYPGT